MACEFPWRCGNLENCYTLFTYLLTYASQHEHVLTGIDRPRRHLSHRQQQRSYNTTTKKTKKTRSSAIAEGPRDASCQLKSFQLPRNSAETTCTTSPKPSISCRLLTRATKSCCRQLLTICAINYSGRESELGGIIDLVDRRRPVYHALSVHLSRAKLITRFDDRYAVAKFCKSGV